MRVSSEYITSDSYEHVTVYRNDERVADFQCRISPATSAVAGQDVQRALGDASKGYYVAAMNTQLAVDNVVIQGDEVWTAVRRYRVVSVDVFPHTAQMLLQHIQ